MLNLLFSWKEADMLIICQAERYFDEIARIARKTEQGMKGGEKDANQGMVRQPLL